MMGRCNDDSDHFEEAWNKGHLEILDEILSPHYINHSPGAGTPPQGPEGLKPIVTAMRLAFPDLKYTIENMVAWEDQVAVHTTVHGTHRADLFGLAPTNKVMNVKQMQIERIQNNQIIEHWRLTHELTMLRQLGQLTS